MLDNLVDKIEERIECTTTKSLAGLADRLLEMVGEQIGTRLDMLPMKRPSGIERTAPSRVLER